MKIIAKFRCQFEGRIFDPGDATDYDGPITDRIAYNFNGEDGEPLTVASDNDTDTQGEKPPEQKKTDKEIAAEKIEKVLKTFSREQLMARLDEFGITYKPQNKNEQLARFYLRATGEID